MPKFFVVSDVHGFYDEMIRALNEAGYDAENPDHWIISCGDNFDRGHQNLKVQKFFMKTPRSILIRGNHEDLFDWAIRDGFSARDFSNGTYQTIQELGRPKVPGAEYMSQEEIMEYAFRATRKFFGRMVNFFETKNYIFVHGWIPPRRKCPGRDWRYASESQWERARWDNGMEKALEGMIEQGKTIVCGHWHTSWGHNRVDGTPVNGPGANFEPFYAEGIIAIDGCTALTHKVNVVVLEDEFIE